MEAVFLGVYMLAIPLITAVLAAVIVRKMLLRELAASGFGESAALKFGQGHEQTDETKADTDLAELFTDVRCDMASQRGGEKLIQAVTTIKNEYALTERETEILRELFAGHGNKAIAAKLFISENTVKTHIHNLLQKMGAANRLEALERVRRLMSEAECGK